MNARDMALIHGCCWLGCSYSSGFQISSSAGSVFHRGRVLSPRRIRALCVTVGLGVGLTAHVEQKREGSALWAPCVLGSRR